MAKKLGLMVILSLLITLYTGCTSTTDTDDVSSTEEVIENQQDQTNSETDIDMDENTTQEDTPMEPIVVEPSFGGILRMACDPYDTLDPLLSMSQTTQTVLSLIYEPLFKIDENYDIQNILVENYVINSDATSITLNLKSDIFFHDGQPLTSADVEYTINLIKDNLKSPYYNMALPIRHVTIVDDWTLTLYFDRFQYAYMYDLTFPVISKTATSDREAWPIGTGPYKYVDDQTMQNISLTYNETYHGEKPYIQDIVFTVTDAEAVREDMFNQKLIDLLMPSRFDWLKYSDNDVQNLTEYQSAYYDFVGFNYANPLSQNLNFKKAIAHALDRSYMIENQLLGHGQIVDSFVPSSLIEKDSNQFVYNFDIETAKSLLVEGDLIDHDNDGIIDLVSSIDSNVYEPILLKMIYNSDNPLRKEIAPMILTDLTNIGLDIELVALNTEDFNIALESGDYDLVYAGYKIGQKPDYSPLIGTDGALNFGGYSDAKIDQLLDQVYYAGDRASLISDLSQLDLAVIEALPVVSLYYLNGAVMTNDEIYGTLSPTTYEMLTGIETLYTNH